MKDCV